MESKSFGEVAVAIPPGISWTAPEKSRAWLRPPSEVDVATIAKQYMGVLSSPASANDVLDVLETNVPISVIAESFMLAGVSKGLHTVDAGVLVMPVIMETLKTIADFNDIKTVMFSSELDDKKVHPRILRKVAAEMMGSEEIAVEETMPAEEEAMPTGLMSRKKEGV